MNRLTSAHEEGVGINTTRTYQYDTLGNLIRQEQDGCIEYKYNGYSLDETTKCGTIPNSIGTSYWEYTYDGRGNLVSNDKYTRTTSGMAWQNEETYVYDETNHLVQGKNEQGEVSLYTYNGLGIRVGRELIVKDNTHGYTDFHSQTPSVETGLTKPEVVKESYVIDYTSATFNTLVMDEAGGFNYRWVYGLDRLSVKITGEGTNWWGQHVTTDILKDYTHQDRLGSTVNLSDQFGRVVGRADYNEWGEVTYKEALSITSSYRRIWPQLNYTGYDWDDVLGMYYAKARFYSADDKRFVAIDPIKGSVTDPLSLVSYLYCVDNPLRYVDPLGLVIIDRHIYEISIWNGGGVESISQGKTIDLQIALEALGYLKMGTDKNGLPVPYGIYGGATASAIQLFKFNYGGDYTTGAESEIDSELYLKIMNVYINKTFNSYTYAQKKKLYDSYRKDVIKHNDELGFTNEYYPLYQCEIPKSAVISKQMKSRGVELVIDYETVDNIIRMDITQAADEMLKRNAEEVLKHRYPTREELFESNVAYQFFYPQSLEDDYATHMFSSIMWLMSKDWHDADWDIKLKDQFETQLMIEFLGQQTEFYVHGEKMRPEDLGNLGYAYWASMLGMTENDIYFGSTVAGWFGKGGSDDNKDLYYMKKGIEQFRIDYPQYAR